jgi:hypothetical protein
MFRTPLLWCLFSSLCLYSGATVVSQESQASSQPSQVSSQPASETKLVPESSAVESAAPDLQAPTESAIETLESAADAEAANQARIKELLSLVSDNTLYNHKRENKAYFALVREVLRHTPEQLRSQARENPRFDNFHKSPSAHRGELVHLAVNLRRILPIEIKFENEAGVKQLYELWGWTDEAKAHMYCCITPELPPGFPTSGDVAQRIELTGYFFKLQAYQPGDAPPNARNQVAPVVIGRVTSAPKMDLQSANSNSKWPLYLICGFGVIIMLRLMMQVRAFTRPTPTHRNYRRRSLEPVDPESFSHALGHADNGVKIRNADE